MSPIKTFSLPQQPLALAPCRKDRHRPDRKQLKTRKIFYPTSEAHYTELNFFRSLTEIGDQSLPILPADPKVALIQVALTTGLKPEINNVLGITYGAQEAEIDKTQVETYPLKDVMSAWEEIKTGQGTAYIGSTEDLRTVQINSITLAYFDDAAHQDYLQPIYVFSGVAKTASNKEVEFVAYSQAVSSDWFEEWGRG